MSAPPVRAWAVVRPDGVPIMLHRSRSLAEHWAAHAGADNGGKSYRVVQYAPATVLGADRAISA